MRQYGHAPEVEAVMAALDALLPVSEEWGKRAVAQVLYPGEEEEREY